MPKTQTVFAIFDSVDVREILHTEMDRLWEHNMPQNSAKAPIFDTNSELCFEKPDFSVVY